MKEEFVVVSIRMPVDLKLALEADANIELRSFTAQVVKSLTEFYERKKK